jgi:hypothetical protein
MSTYNNNRFTPGNKSNLRKYIAQSYLTQYYGINNIEQKAINSCCIQPQVKLLKQGYTDSTQTENARFSRILTGPLGGKTTYGNANHPVILNYLGGSPGQPGGIPRPPRNTF